MKVIIVGCNWLSIELANNLYQRGHQVTVVDPDFEALKRLPPTFRGRIVEGDPLNQGVLERAGIKTADAIAIVTNTDTVNAVVGHIAQSVYHVPRIIVRNYEQRWMPLYETFELNAVSPTLWGAERIEALLQPTMLRLVATAGNGEVEIYEIKLPAEWQGQRLSKLMEQLPDCLPVAFIRHGEASLPRADLVLEAEDLLHLSLPRHKLSELKRLLKIEEA